MKHADTEQDNSTVEKYLKGLRRSRDPASAMVSRKYYRIEGEDNEKAL